MTTTNTLECSSAGDIRFSALRASVTFNGKFDTIENHYQLAKRFGEMGEQKYNHWRDAKGKKPTYMYIKDKLISLDYTLAFYDLLWVKYLDQNPELVKYANQYTYFSDKFMRRNGIVSQSRSIHKYVKFGRDYIINQHKDFLDLFV